MSKKDHYEILGVERTEDESGIRTAFRQLAKRHHPDLSGPETTRHFQEIVEAYAVLSDPEARASYNESLRERDASFAAAGAGGRHFRSSQTVVAVRSPRAWFSMPRGERRPHSFAEEVFGHLFKGFAASGPGGRARQRKSDLEAEVVLSLEEARRGGILPLRNPRLLRCRFCGRMGLDAFLVCGFCNVQGVADRSEAYPVRIPAGIEDGSIIEIDIDNSDESPVVLRLHVRVRDA